MPENSARDTALTERMAELMGWKYGMARDTGYDHDVWLTGEEFWPTLALRAFHPLKNIATAHECLEAWADAEPVRGYVLSRSAIHEETRYLIELYERGKLVTRATHKDSRCRAIVEALALALGFKFEEVEGGE